jgi:aspartate ammonia-lyase
MGNDLTVSMAVQGGQLDLNVMMPVMAYNVLDSMNILKNFLPVFTARCVRGITVQRDRCRHYFEESVALATILNPRIGYLKAAEVAKESEQRGLSIVEIILEKGLLTRAELDKILDPETVTGFLDKPSKRRAKKN